MAHPPSRRALLGAAAALTVAPLVAASAVVLPVDPDADLVRACHQFAEYEYRNWWLYVTAPDTPDERYPDLDWTVLHGIETTPATTAAGWAAKALALSAWNREAFDDSDAQADASSGLLAGLLRDMVAPARAEILARCEADYGPLPEGYTADGCWIEQAPVIVGAAVPPLAPHADAALLAACEAFTQAEAEVARLERTAEDDVFEPAVSAMHAVAERVSGFRARTVGGLRAKAAVCRAVLAAEEPRAVAGAFGNKVQRHDVLAWSTLRDLVEVAG